jgi:UDP-N-acetylmuramyl pentapeptide phosphotransferase/UDP-N-acetylglucosamine-1-phosphate transferase
MPFESLVKYLAVFIAGLAVALVVAPLWRSAAPRWGFMDRPGGRKIHSRPVAVGGGIAVFLGFHAACAAIFLFSWAPFAGQLSIDWWMRFLPLSVGVVALGLLDDRFDMRPGVKLAGQTVLALAAYAVNIRVQNVLGMTLPEWVNGAGTVLWFLILMNAFNLIDGLDGLAAGIALIASVGIGISLVFRQAPGDVLLFAGLAGACLGFLRYNFYPASIFLGDTGSLFIGFTLAALTISTSSKGTAIAAIGVPLLAVGVPLFDTALAVWRRSMRRLLHGRTTAGAAPRIAQGDADHLHHRLLRQGHRHDRVAWLLYGATALLAVTGVLATIDNSRALGILGIAFVVAVYVIFRHLVWVELRDTGEVILRGIARPVRRNLSLLFYIVSDLIILNIAWMVAMLLTGACQGTATHDMKRLWLQTAPVDIGIPFLALLGARAYSRVWSLAGVLEFGAVGMALLLGGAGAGGISLVIYTAGSDPSCQVLRYIVLMGMALPGIVGIRAVFRLVPELMHHRSVPESGSAARSRTLIWGAGPEVMLYLRFRVMAHQGRDQGRVIGIVTNDDAMIGHYLSGIQVLGHARDLAALIRRERVERVVAVGEIDGSRMAALRRELAVAGGVQWVHWRVSEKEVDPDSMK